MTPLVLFSAVHDLIITITIIIIVIAVITPDIKIDTEDATATMERRHHEVDWTGLSKCVNCLLHNASDAAMLVLHSVNTEQKHVHQRNRATLRRI